MIPNGAPTLRRFWPAIACLLVLVLISLVHTLAFRPLAAHYRLQLAGAGEVGASIDPSLASAPLPPRVVDLMRDNSVAAPEADRLARSGGLATELVRRVSEIAGRCGIDVVASAPGATTQTILTLEVRAALQFRCRYEQFITLLDEMAKQQALYRVEQFTLTPMPGGRVAADVSVSRVVLKRDAPSP